MRKMLLALAITAVLVGCTDREERAEAHYQSALALLDEGDVTRAMIELRNVLQNDGFHQDGRRLYADLLFQSGDMTTAYGQYLRLVEQRPDAVTARLKLAEIAMDTGDWAEVRRHGQAAAELAPDALPHQAIAVLLAYRSARDQGNDNMAMQHVEDARALLQQDPTLDTALRVLVDWLGTGATPAQALPYLDQMLARHPGSMGLHLTRLRLLNAAGQDDAVGAHLRAMADQFPDDVETGRLLLRWHLAKGQLDVAEADLRRRAGADDGPFGAHLNVVSLVERARGPAAALDELDRLARANGATDLGRRYALYAVQRRFNAGDRAQISVAHGLLDRAQQPELMNEVRFVLSEMYRSERDPTRAKAQIEAILASDATHVPALIVRGQNLLTRGDIDSAVGVLRQARNQEPRNTDALVLLAKAQQALGNAELAEQRLAQAFEVSDGDENIAILFAQFQTARGNSRAAILILTESVRGDPSRLRAAAHLADLLITEGDVGAARDLLGNLEARQDRAAEELTRTLRAAILFQENRIEDSLNALRRSEAGTDLSADVQMLRVLILSQRFDEARAQLDTLRAQFPEDQTLQKLEGNLLAFEHRLDDAIDVFEALHSAQPDDPAFVHRLYALLSEAGRFDDASALVAKALGQSPDSVALQVLVALDHERSGDMAPAIAIHKALYEADPTNLTIANNYASLLAYYADDPASLVLARQVAAPLTGVQDPAYLDTLGYITLREGNAAAAAQQFERAARKLPDNPTILFNLGLAYAAQGRTDAATQAFERGFDLAGTAQNVPQMDRARIALASLKHN